jgi:hypothetical protein
MDSCFATRTRVPEPDTATLNSVSCEVSIFEGKER